MWAVHPRACGELGALYKLADDSNGSSPRVRGTRQIIFKEHYLERFIPARAGNSTATAPARSSTRVHPRACGELAGAESFLEGCAGSSPRVRGTPPKPRFPLLDLRFIPARAGNSHATVLTDLEPTVHPRACGELCSGIVSVMILSGSSPRVRGTQPGPGRLQGYRRFIPARAGNSMSFRVSMLHIPVHPRACGELMLPPGPRSSMDGSSPRVRGTLTNRAHSRRLPRFIPARAGNSRHKGF